MYATTRSRRANARIPLSARLAAAACLALAAACSDGGGGGGPSGPGPVNGPASIVRVSSATAAGQPGYALDDSVAVRVLDRAGAPMSGVAVTFSVTGGGGAASPGVAQTDASGVARAAWTLGGAEGANALRASVSTAGVAPAEFTATGTWGPEARIELVSGNGQEMPGACAALAPLVVRVRDAAGAPLANAPVYFTVTAGGGVTSARRVVTDAQGLASAAWTMGTGSGTENAATAAIRARTPAEVRFRATSSAMVPGGYAVVGNQVISGATCRPHRFTGVARSGLESWHRGDDRLIDPALAAEDFRNMRAWGANVVRIPLNQAFWLTGTKAHYPEYAALVDATVQRAKAAGLDVILDLHYSDKGDPNATSFTIQRMADANHSVRFWREVAAKYKNDPRVMFELYNEPHDISWDVWLNGGATGDGFTAAGYQDLYDAVRQAGAHNLVIANGLNWGFDLSGAATHRVRGHNVMYGTHVYDWPEKQADAWDAGYGYLAASAPVMIGEFGTMNCGVPYYQAVMDYADRKGLHWIGWAWWAPPADRMDLKCTFAALLQDWNGTPNEMGSAVRARLQSYR